MNDVLTVSEFAKRLKVQQSTVYAAIQADRLRAVQFVGRIVIPITELRRFKRRRNGAKTKVFRKAV